MIISFQLNGEMGQYAKDISDFVNQMLAKLEKNLHKGRWEGLTINYIMDCLAEEILELNDALEDGDKQAIYFEAADVANFAMIIASITRDSNVDLGRTGPTPFGGASVDGNSDHPEAERGDT